MTQCKDVETMEATAAIKSLISSFFDAINAADTQALQALFVEQAHVVIVRQDPPLPPPSCLNESVSPKHRCEGKPGRESAPRGAGEETLTVVIRTSIERFVKLLEEGKKRREGRPVPVIDEKPDLVATDIKVDGLFGVAWSPFQVTFDGVLHHYGTMVFTVGKMTSRIGKKEWKIEGLTQNYRRTPGWEK
ncbi:uncharacterized protein PV09_07246 [Verruconis gallopava]|uniref:SnoaL-like domain-containing protein n=1 Tax=Verruconis gallopava TaxID=253628 RepID=A0A0D1YK02_9PEZI|nr:uncharacterized protein PV09_07246 [Verruconis gallopava]KIW01197.1 hypothetical protein PV09_07246 [Verruconis gallopava]